MAETQTSMLLKHLKQHGSITSMEAFERYGITRLSAKIFCLREQGYDIQTKSETCTNRYGRRVAYARYEFKGDTNED